MTGSEQERADFLKAMGESFADAVCPPVDFEAASPHECCEPVFAVLGEDVTPAVLARLSGDRMADIATAFGRYFEVEPPAVAQIEAGVAATLFRWPADGTQDGAP